MRVREGRDLLPVRHPPQGRRLVTGSRREDAPVWGEGDGGDRARRRESRDLRPVRHPPEGRRRASRRKDATVGREGDGGYRARVREGRDLRPVRHPPEGHRRVVTSRREDAPIGRKGDGDDLVRVRENSIPPDDLPLHGSGQRPFACEEKIGLGRTHPVRDEEALRLVHRLGPLSLRPLLRVRLEPEGALPGLEEPVGVRREPRPHLILADALYPLPLALGEPGEEPARVELLGHDPAREEQVAPPAHRLLPLGQVPQHPLHGGAQGVEGLRFPRIPRATRAGARGWGARSRRAGEPRRRERADGEEGEGEAVFHRDSGGTNRTSPRLGYVRRKEAHTRSASGEVSPDPHRLGTR